MNANLLNVFNEDFPIMFQLKQKHIVSVCDIVNYSVYQNIPIFIADV